MEKLKVIGFVGEESLEDLNLEDNQKPRVLKALRDFVEDRLESKYAVFAQLAVASSGVVDVSIIGVSNDVTRAELLMTAVESVADFKRSLPTLIQNIHASRSN
jgi:hypothetical protein